MSAIENTQAATQVQPENATRPSVPVLVKVLNLFSSVRFGVTLLIVLAIACMIGMLIMQQSVEGFEKYYAELQPSQRLLYGALGFFNIYHAWYFNALLLVLSVNIVLASIERFPKTWRIISHRKLEAGRQWLNGQMRHRELAVEGESLEAVTRDVAAAYRRVGLKPVVTEKNGRAFVFGERGAWNRLGAYAVHVALLTIFTGGFLTSQFGRDGQMPLEPGTSASEVLTSEFHLDQVSTVAVPLPFTVACTDIQQKLIHADGAITADNTLDWLTRIKIRDETGEREGLVHLNEPFDYRGYRFFQASFTPFGQARRITLRLTPENGKGTFEITIPRGGTGTLEDGTRIEFTSFQPDFKVGQQQDEDSESGEYNNPAAILNVTTPSGVRKTVYAFAAALPEGAPVAAPFGGYRYHLADFEKVPLRHILAVHKDPGKAAFYTGGALLILTLCGVFFFSHQRVWALIENSPDRGGGFDVVLGGNTNRNRLGFEDRFETLSKLIGGESREVTET